MSRKGSGRAGTSTAIASAAPKKVHFNLDLTSKGVKIALQPTICLNPQEFVENELNSLLCMVIIEIISGPWDFPIRTAAGGVFFVGFLLVTDFA